MKKFKAVLLTIWDLTKYPLLAVTIFGFYLLAIMSANFVALFCLYLCTVADIIWVFHGQEIMENIKTTYKKHLGE